MAIIQRIDDWLADHAEALGLQLQVFTWPEALLPGYHDLKVTIELYGHKFCGRGLSADEDLALVKAGGEALERVLCFERKIGSNGVAVHSSTELAGEAATIELIERDRILSHHLESVPGQDVSPSGLAPAYARLESRLAAKSIQLKLRRLRPLNGVETVLCLAHSRDFAALFGAGAALSLIEAAEKSILECMVNVSAQFENKLGSPLSLKDFSALGENVQPIDHTRLYLHSDARPVVESLYLRSEPVETESYKPAIETLELKFQHPLLNGVPLKGSRAHSEGLRKLYWGVTADAQAVNTFPHPVG